MNRYRKFLITLVSAYSVIGPSCDRFAKDWFEMSAKRDLVNNFKFCHKCPKTCVMNSERMVPYGNLCENYFAFP